MTAAAAWCKQRWRHKRSSTDGQDQGPRGRGRKGSVLAASTDRVCEVEEESMSQDLSNVPVCGQEGAT